MEAEIAAGKFIESANVHGNLYGTSKAAVEAVAHKGRICILDVDIQVRRRDAPTAQGVRSCQHSELPVAQYIFISPPTVHELEARLRKRNTETEERIQRRIANGAREMEEAEETHFDSRLINDDLDACYATLRALLLPEIEALRAASAPRE